MSLEKEAFNVMRLLKKGVLEDGGVSIEEGRESEFTRAYECGHFVQDQFNFASDGVAHSPGFVEALCVMESAKRKLSSAKANDLIRYYLFPESQLQASWWRATLSPEAIETHHWFEGIIRGLEK